MRSACLAIAAILVCGCIANSPVTRAAGSWPGQFRVLSVDGKSDSKQIESEAMTAQLELYVTADKFKLDVTARHQSFGVTGKWTADKDGRVTMTADNFTFDSPTDEDQKALGLKLVTGDEVRATFGHPLVLDESPDRRRLTGLETTLGRLVGRLEFVRPIPH